jgi:tol-pal system protein YbgF
MVLMHGNGSPFQMRPMPALRAGIAALAVIVALSASVSARADLFGDDQARQAILDLRKRLDQTVLAQNKLVEDNGQLRRGLLDLQQQIDALKEDLARERGQNEQLVRQVDDLQKQQTALQQQVAASASAVRAASAPQADQGGASTAGQDDGASDQQPQVPTAPVPVASSANVREKQDYDAALTQFRGGNFTAAQTGFAGFVKRYPRSLLAPAALFWLGNAQYATRNYKEAIGNFRSLLSAAPQHEKAPEALLSIANCQIELKDQKAARAALEELVKNYPRSEAASAARDRLAKMK